MNIFKKIMEWFKPFSFINVFFYILICIVFLSAIALTIMFFSTSEDVVSAVPNTSGKNSPKDYLVILGFLAAGLTLTYNIRRNLSEDYFKEAREQLKKAFDTLNVRDEEGAISNDRLRWLTTARTLLIAERIGKKIMMGSHKEIHVEDRQFWRMQFHGIVKNFPEEFYAQDPEDMIWHDGQRRSPISESSLVIIHDFIDWDASYKDPLKSDSFSEEKLDLLDRHYPNMVGVLRAVRRIRAEMRARAE